MSAQLRYYTPRDLPWLAARVACPAQWPHYVVPGSHLWDPVWAHQVPPFPYPRAPWPYESETRAAGTGLIASFAGTPCVPCATAQSAAAAPFTRPQWAQQALGR